MSTKATVVVMCICCFFAWAQEIEPVRASESIHEIAIEVKGGFVSVESEKRIDSDHNSELDVEAEITLSADELDSFVGTDDINRDMRGSDVLVSNNSPRPPHAHSCLAKEPGTNTVYCACEGVFEGDPQINVYRSSDNGQTWQRIGAWRSTTPGWTYYYPSIAVTDNYVVVAYDARYNGETRRLRCKRAPIGSTTWERFIIDEADPPQGCGLSDIVWLGGNTVGCVYNYQHAATDHDIRYKKSTDGGATWTTTPVTVWGDWFQPNNDNYFFRPKIWYGSGLLYVTFWDIENDTLHYSKSTDQGSNWTTWWFTQHLYEYPDICSYGSNYILIPCRYVANGHLNYVWTSDGGATWWRSWGPGFPTEYPECIEQNGNWCVAYTRDGNAYYATSPHTDRPFGFVQIDDPDVIVEDDVVGICRDVSNRSHVSWTDTRDGQTIWGEMPARTDEYITVTFPNGNERFVRDSYHAITWNSNVIGEVRVDLYKGGSFDEHLGDRLASTKSLFWYIPADKNPGTDYRIKITSKSNPLVEDFSDGDFSIYRRIEVTSPDGGESWPIESQQTITWTTSGVGGTVKIEYSCDGGTHYPGTNLIASDAPDVGSFPWTIPYTPTSIARVRITHNTDTENNDESDGTFEIPQPANIVDHSDDMPPVGDQRPQGSCAAWATAYYYKTHQEWREHGWDLSLPQHQFSPAFIYNQINGGVDSGSCISDAMDLLIDHGCANLNDCPYDPYNHVRWPSEDAYYNAIPYRCQSCSVISVTNDAGIADLKQHLADGDNAVLSIELHPNFYEIGAYNNMYCVANSFGEAQDTNHAVCIVGYDDNLPTDDGIGAFHIVNSWGTDFGDLGYFWMSYEAVKNDFTSNGTAYYTEDRKGYAPSAISRFKVSHPTREWVDIVVGIGPPGSATWSKHFFNWIMPPKEGHTFPDNNIVLDITEGVSNLDPYNTNNVFIECRDDTSDGQIGTIEHLTVVNNEWGAFSPSLETPVSIPDDYSPAYANLTMPTQVLHWQSFHRLPDNTGITELIGDMEVADSLWAYITGLEFDESAALGDVDSDGLLEIVVGAGELYALNGEDGSVLWHCPTGSDWSSPALGDIDADGKLEVVVGSNDYNIYALNAEDGSFLWEYLTGHEIWASPKIGDIDGDGLLEIVIGSRDNNIYALNGDGSILWIYMTGGPVWSDPALGDIDNDGRLEIVIGSCDDTVYALNGEDKSVLWRYFTGYNNNSAPALGDIDSDGKLEVVFGTDGRDLHALNGEDGSVVWTYTTTASNDDVYMGPAIGDIDDDGNQEVVFCNNDVFALNGEDGSVCWTFVNDWIFSSPALGDIDGDGKLEVVTGSWDNKAYALNGEDGSVLWLYVTGSDVRSDPALGDINGDGLLELVIGSYDGNVYALGRIPGPDIAVTPDTLTFEYDDTSADTVKTMMVHNLGNADLIVTDIIADDPWIVSAVPASFTVAPDDSQSVTVTVTSSGLPCGHNYGSLSIFCNDVNEDPYIQDVKLISMKTLWTETYGGPGDDRGYDVQQTTDGGYIIVGSTTSFGAGGEDVFLIKTDANGDTLWTRAYGSPGNDIGRSVCQALDGGYVVAGWTGSNGNGDDVYFIKTDANGDTLWTNTCGYALDDRAYSVDRTLDSCYIVTGYSSDTAWIFWNTGLYLIKIDDDGDTIWTKRWLEFETDRVGYCVKETADSGYIITGYNDTDYDPRGPLLVKTDADGGSMWWKEDVWYHAGVGYSVQQTHAGEYIAAGVCEDEWPSFDKDVLLFKHESDGWYEWGDCWGGSADDVGYSVCETYDGGYVVAGYTNSFGEGGFDIWLLKVAEYEDSWGMKYGDTLWTNTYGGTADDVGHSVQQTHDGGLIIAGYTASTERNGNDVCLIRIEGSMSFPPSSPHVTRAAKTGDDVELFWNTVDTDTLGASTTVEYYTVYRDTIPSYIPSSAESIGTVLPPETTFVDAGALLADKNYYYLVRAVDEHDKGSEKSNMAYVFCKSLNENANATDKNWVSLPWDNNYSTVSDLTDDLSPAGDPLVKITNLRDVQEYESWLWDDMFLKWLGADFAIEPGRGYEMITISDTTVVLAGCNAPNGLVFLNENADATDKNWVSIPYNAVYDSASDITDEYSPAGVPLTKLTNLRDDQFFESWLWDDLFSEWGGANFAIEDGRGYEFVTTVDTTWNPTEYSNEATDKFLASRLARLSNVTVQLGRDTESLRAPVWTSLSSASIETDLVPVFAANELVAVPERDEVHNVDSKKPHIDDGISTVPRTRERHYALSAVDAVKYKGSHTVRFYLKAEKLSGVLFTAYRLSEPTDVLTERTVGSCISYKSGLAALSFDAGNFGEPRVDGEEIIIIVEALAGNRALCNVSNIRLDGSVDIQDLGFTDLVNLQQLASENANVVGFSVYNNDTRSNEEPVAIAALQSTKDVEIRPIIRGGYETVYSTDGRQSRPDEQIPLAFSFVAFPNPFSRQVVFDYALPTASNVNINIYDVCGRHVKTMVSDNVDAGYYSTIWDCVDDNNRTVSCGIYFVKCETDNNQANQKLLFVR